MASCKSHKDCVPSGLSLLEAGRRCAIHCPICCVIFLCHPLCHPGLPFCYVRHALDGTVAGGMCTDCSECHDCDDGIDGNCGPYCHSMFYPLSGEACPATGAADTSHSAQSAALGSWGMSRCASEVPWRDADVVQIWFRFGSDVTLCVGHCASDVPWSRALPCGPRTYLLWTSLWTMSEGGRPTRRNDAHRSL